MQQAATSKYKVFVVKFLTCLPPRIEESPPFKSTAEMCFTTSCPRLTTTADSGRASIRSSSLQGLSTAVSSTVPTAAPFSAIRFAVSLTSVFMRAHRLRMLTEPTPSTLSLRVVFSSSTTTVIFSRLSICTFTSACMSSLVQVALEPALLSVSVVSLQSAIATHM